MWVYGADYYLSLSPEKEKCEAEENWYSDTQNEIKHLKKSKKKSEKELKRLHQAVGDFHKTEEIHQTYENISNYIEEIDSEIKQCKAALHFTQVLYDMVDSAKYLDNEVNYYVGVESGTNPKIENTED